METIVCSAQSLVASYAKFCARLCPLINSSCSWAQSVGELFRPSGLQRLFQPRATEAVRFPPAAGTALFQLSCRTRRFHVGFLKNVSRNGGGVVWSVRAIVLPEDSSTEEKTNQCDSDSEQRWQVPPHMTDPKGITLSFIIIYWRVVKHLCSSQWRLLHGFNGFDALLLSLPPTCSTDNNIHSFTSTLWKFFHFKTLSLLLQTAVW